MQEHPYDTTRQFKLLPKEFLSHLGFLNWYRYFFIIQELTRLQPKTVLEVGPGDGVIQRVFEGFTEAYQTLDVNPRLAPDFVGDVRKHVREAEGMFDVIVAADILEHIPFQDLEGALKNLHSYLTPQGHALITIPHRGSNFLWMTPTQVPHTFRVPPGFLSFGGFYRRFIKRRIWIDPDHKWEIGDGHHTVTDVEKVLRNAGFLIEKRTALLYVDFWILKKLPDGSI